MNFRRDLLFLVVVFLAIACTKEEIETSQDDSSTGTSTLTSNEDLAYIPGEAIIKLSDEMNELVEEDIAAGKLATRSMGLNQALDELGITSIERLFPDAGKYEGRTRREGLHKWYIVKYSEDVTPTRADAELKAIDGVEHSEKVIRKKMLDFDDPYLSNQWGFGNSTTSGADINVKKAWDKGIVGNSSVIVAVVDGGIALSHPDLADNCYSDNYNFTNSSTTIEPLSHGTHVAGTIAAINNNGIGVCGVAGGDYANGKSGVKLMSCQIFSSSYQGSTSRAIKWAADHGAVICQNSWAYDYDYNEDGQLTGSELTDAMNATIDDSDKEAVDYFIKYAGCDDDGNQLEDSPMKGGVVVFAAGNEDIANGAPGNYEPIIAVGAIDSDGKKASYSNYGDFVDICAPGTNIYSTNTSGYVLMSGTSMACPHVSGVAALIASYCGKQGFTNELLKQKLFLGASSIVDSTQQIGSLVDAWGALTYDETLSPAAVTDLEGTASANTIKLSWTATCDTNSRDATGYLVVYSQDRDAVENATPTSLGDASSMTVTDSKTAGETMNASVKDLEFTQTYYLKIYAYSFSYQYSDPSSVIQVQTGTNNPPVIELADGQSTEVHYFETVDFLFNIYDPDEHDITVNVTRGSIAESYSDGTLTVVAPKVDPGTYTSVITAEDEYGASTTLDFTYTILENTPPEVVSTPENVRLTSIGQRLSIDLSQYIADPDGETLSYTCTSSNESMVNTSFNGTTLLINLRSMGITTITITGTDGKDESASVSFTLLGRASGVDHLFYPNPVKDTLYISTDEETMDTSISIYSQSGTEIYSDTVPSSAFVPAAVDLSSVAPGTYSLTVEFGTKKYTQTIVKQ